MHIKRAHESHIMFDNDQRVFFVDFAQQLARSIRSRASVMPATGSSTSSRSRILRQQHADFQPLLLAVGNLARKPCAMLQQPGGFKDRIDLRRVATLLRQPNSEANGPRGRAERQQ